MKYSGQHDDFKKSSSKTGVLLLNLGTPARPVCPGLRDYLSEFLMDPRVIELPKFFRWLLVRGIIVNFRSHKSAATYRKIWTDDGSPLFINSQKLATKVQQELGEEYVVELAMRYGAPSVADKIGALHKAGIRKLIAIPLYPQYSGSTNGSTFDAIAAVFAKQRWIPDFKFVSDYYQRPDYIAAIGESIKEYWHEHGRNQLLVMSFHGVPKNFITQGDPYQMQCEQSAQRIADYLGLGLDQWKLVFQSRLGAQEWLQPYCDQTLKELPSQGIDSVDIVCPGFSADCLETLEEIEQENKEYFLEAGGKQYSYIPCLNDSASQTLLMSDIVKEQAE
ncbi:MAG: ferrochelatase [Cryomorphaceae bacterium]|jgi:ferrochelatase